jgi:hypothetical protein
MKVIGVMQKPTLKVVKTEDGAERPVIKIELVVPYTEENWSFVGMYAGSPLSVFAEPSQYSMFDSQTGEIKAARR